MRLLAVFTEASEILRSLRGIGEQAEVPHQAPARARPYRTSRALRRRAFGDAAA
jgi:hypothetical protein